MQELIQQLMSNAGLTHEQATKAVQTMQGFIRTKLPAQMSGMVDSFFTGNFDANAAAQAVVSKPEEESWLDKAKEMAAEAGDHISDFAKKAGKQLEEWADKAEGKAESAGEKVKDFFDRDKNTNDKGAQPQDTPAK